MGILVKPKLNKELWTKPPWKTHTANTYQLNPLKFLNLMFYSFIANIMTRSTIYQYSSPFKISKMSNYYNTSTEKKIASVITLATLLLF